jgi:hypothetical protein
MDPENYADEGPGKMAEAAPRGHFRGRHQITSKRRRELAALAGHFATEVEAKTQPHERCLLRQMVENLLPDRDD